MLLIRFVVPRDGASFAFWATPGGGVEDGEDDRAAIERELREELGVSLPLLGPVHSATSRFEHEGAMTESVDVFFLGRWSGAEPVLAGVDAAERSTMRALRWWSPEEIDGSVDPVFPVSLAALVRQLT